MSSTPFERIGAESDPAVTVVAKHSDAASSDFKGLWQGALSRYEKVTGRNLLEIGSFAHLMDCESTEDVARELKLQRDAFKVFRVKGQRIRAVLDPLLRLSSLFLDTGAEIAGSSGAVLGGKAIIVAFGVLLQATNGVSRVYDALEGLLSRLEGFLSRVDLYLRLGSTALSGALGEIFKDMLVQLLLVFALFTRYLGKHVRGIKKFLPLRIQHYTKVLLNRNKDILAALDELDRLTSEEELRTAAETRVAVDMVRNQVEAVRGVIINYQIDEEISRWLDHPDPPGHSSKHNQLLKLLGQRSNIGKWFLDWNTQFSAWRKGTKSVYWIYGKAGSGKSVLCSSIINALSAEPGTLLTYFYFDFTNAKEQTLSRLLSSLIVQLSSLSEACFHALRLFYSKRNFIKYDMDLEMDLFDGKTAGGIFTRDSKFNGPHVGPRQATMPHSALRELSREDILFHCLKLMLRRASTNVYIIFDAVDECPESEREADILPFLTKLVLLDVQGLRLLLTSRPEFDIKKAVKSFDPYSLNLPEAVEQGHELANFIEEELSKDIFDHWGADFKKRVREKLVSKAGGMFLWVRLQLVALRKCAPGDLRKALDELPKDLNATYERILLNINQGLPRATAVHLRRIFECIAFATRPLSPDEAAEIIAVDFSAKPGAVLRPSRREANPESFLERTCSGLLEIVSKDTFDGLQRIVQFVHSSAREYLLNRLTTTHALSIYHLDRASAHNTLATMCLTTILSEPSSLHAQPLWSYAVSGWFHHIQSSTVDGSDVYPLLQQFLRSSSSAYIHWQTVWINDHPDEDKREPLHWASWLGLCRRAQELLEGEQVPQPSGASLGFSLCTAASRGHRSLTFLLLNHNADRNAIIPNRQTALHLAAENGHCEVCQVLIESGATVHARGTDGDTPLHRAAQNGHIEVCRLLVENGAAVDARKKNNWMPLHVAAGNGHLEVCQLLAEKGATIDARGKDDWTPLHIAAQKDRLEICRFFVERGAIVDVRDKNNLTPLHAAAWYGQLEVCRLLVEKGTAVDARDGHSWTPLHVAAQNGHVEVCRLLVENGATVDARTKDDWTPLHVAAGNGHLEICRFFVERGAVVDAREKDDGTPLHVAAQNGHLEVCQFLIEKGTAVDARGKDDWTPLRVAAQKGHLEICRFFVRHGAAVDARDKKNWTPLHSTARNGHHEVCRLLVENSAAVNARDKDDCTSLYLAAWSGRFEVCRLLVKHGAEVDTRDKDDWTPLHVAARNGHFEVCRFLIENSAAIDARGKGDWRPLHLAAGNGHLETGRFLVENGATVDTRNKDDWTPLHLAAENGHHEVCRLLLNNGASAEGRDDYEHTPIQLAARGGSARVLRILFERGAAVDSCDKDGTTALGYAAIEGHVDVVRSLLSFGATLEIRDKAGWTPLLGAASRGHSDVARLLLERGANCETRSDAGYSVLMYASSQGHLDVVSVLLDNHANVTAADVDGFRALDHACAAGHAQVVRLLLEHGAGVCAASPYGSYREIAERARRAHAIRGVTEPWGRPETARISNPGDVTGVLEDSDRVAAQRQMTVRTVRKVKSSLV